MESQFGIIPGVIRTRVGYAGGEAEHPTYSRIGDHTETVQIDFDPQRITYGDLLRIFWNSHSPTDRTWDRQYMHAVFYHDENQHQQALVSKAALQKETGRTIRTAVLPLHSFTMAEDYHQKYLLNRRSELVRELKRIYPLRKDFVDSTAVARLNGYIGGHGGMEQLTGEIQSLGLSAESRHALMELVRGRKRSLFN